MKLLHTQHYSGSISEFYLNDAKDSIIELKTNSTGDTKEYKHDIDSFEIVNFLNKSSIGDDYSKFRSLDQYRQTKDAVYKNN